MKINLSRQTLLKATSTIQSIVERRSTMPILSNFVLEAKDGRLFIYGSDLDTSGYTSAEIDVEQPGSITVNAKVLCDIVRELPEGTVQLLTSEGERLEIKAHNTSLKIIGASADEYPKLSGLEYEPTSKFMTGELQEMISKTIYAVSSDETRFNLTGICVENITKENEKSLRMSSTDGYRLAIITRPNNTLSFNDRVIVPKKGMAEVRKLLENEVNDTVDLDIHNGFLIFKTSDSKFSIRLIDGEFPDIENVIPSERGTIVKLSAKELAQALRRISLLVTEKGKCVKFDFAENLLRISSFSSDLGEGIEELPIEYSGDAPVSIGFNAKYILDFISVIHESDNLVIELNGELGPGKFYSEKDESCFSIIMPMRLKEFDE